MTDVPFQPAYARLYDALYAEKDYAGEARRLVELLDGAGSRGRVVDYGCGTGNHLRELLGAGVDAVGLEPNAAMRAQAEAKLGAGRVLPLERRDEVAPGSAAALLSLFDVVSYLTSHAAQDDFLAYAARTVRAGGLLVFDCWYGPGVIALRPERRWRELRHGRARVLRLSDPEHDPDAQTVRLRFQVFVFDEDPPTWAEHVDVHLMRYFYRSELELLLDRHGFELQRLGTWADLETPAGVKDWSALAVATRRG